MSGHFVQTRFLLSAEEPVGKAATFAPDRNERP